MVGALRDLSEDQLLSNIERNPIEIVRFSAYWQFTVCRNWVRACGWNRNTRHYRAMENTLQRKTVRIRQLINAV